MANPNHRDVEDQIVSAEHTGNPTQPQPREQTPLLNDTTTTRGTNGSSTAPSSSSAQHPQVSTAKLFIIIGSSLVGTFFAALDSTIITTLLAPISNSFNSFSTISWVAAAYLISNAAFQPLFGKLTDIFGRRAGLVFSNVTFGIGTAMCGFATKEWHMILGRVVAGAGGGGLNAISTFVASDLVPLRQRGLAQGVSNIVWGLGSGIGGYFGGAINDSIGWRWAFLVQIPFLVVSLVLVCIFIDIPVRETKEHPLRRVDFLGSLTLVASLVALLLGLNSGGNIVPWSHPLVLTSLPLSAVLLGVFIYVEERVAKEPVIPMWLFLDRTVLSACFTNWFMTISQFIIHFYAPIYFQLLGATPAESGLRLIPQAIGISIGSMGAGALMRATGRYYILNIVTNSVFLLGMTLISTFTLQSLPWQQFVYLFCTGSGYGAMLTVTLLSLIAAVDHSHQAVVTSASYAFRATGSTIGVTIGGAVFQNVLRWALEGRLGGEGEVGENIIRKVLKSFDEIFKLGPRWHDLVVDAYMDALRAVFLVGLGFAAVAWIVGLLIREHMLHSTLDRR